MSDDKENLKEGTLISHLLELRNRLVKMVIAVVVLFFPATFFRNELFDLLAQPLIDKLPAGTSLIATEVVSPFLTPIKVAFFFSVFAAMPFILAQVWGFVSPGLYRKEKHFAIPLLVSSIVLFYVGAAFAYFFVFPVVFGFFAETTPTTVQMMPDINTYLSFAMTMFLAFGVAFEVPVVVVLLTLTGLVSIEKLAAARGYVIIGIFVAAAILTPPDVLSQVMMAIPMWLLYEAGLIMARVLHRKRKGDVTGTEKPGSAA